MLRGEVLSVNLGVVTTLPGVRGRTAIDKQPTQHIDVRDPGPKKGGQGSGVVGDGIGSRKHHGGYAQAVYAYATEDYDWWAAQLGRTLEPGLFGENLTTRGLDLTHALIGEEWTIGSVRLRVEVPRIPCATFAARMGEKQWVRRFTEAGRTGAYLSVQVPGRISAGDVVMVNRPAHDITLLDAFRAVTGDRQLARRVLDAGVLYPTEHEYLAARV
ncbi:MOSC domain-containing protein [Branchiibius sp. NY16-3462-2]|uniref:MOSC domain-containing protein n=1 Tax=Branchiibius sp. NY16-3462-2 TaxID=1807500 RepID=UPI000A6591BB|nr:MOSC domain-containing protein [Branchiibius sp. NY16-3462-2]